MISRIVAGVVLMVLAAGYAVAGEEKDWQQVIGRVAAGLERGDAAQVLEHLTDSAAFTGLDRRPAGLRTLLDQTRSARLIAAIPMEGPPYNLAREIGTAFGDAPVPARLQRLMLPQREASRDAADATARQVVTEALRLQPGQRAAVLVFWHAPQTDDPQDVGRVVFVLLKSEPPDGSISRVASGNPLE